MPDDQLMVSVVLAVYNGEEYIETAVKSVLNQQFDSFELVVVDDGSTDDTVVILSAIDDPRLRLIEQESSGQAAALNHGIAAARGRYIARIDDDDIADPHRLDRQVALLESDPALGVIGTRFVRRYERAETTETESVTPPTTDRELRREFPFRNPFAHSTVMFRREAVREVGGYDESLNSCIDYDLWIRLGATGYRFGVVDEQLNTIRKHDGSAYQFTSLYRLQYYRTAMGIRWRAASTLGVPGYYRVVPLMMFAWALLPESVTVVVKRLLSVGS
jgi:glycosyltransferase involved in cell wall biosynthesis